MILGYGDVGLLSRNKATAARLICKTVTCLGGGDLHIGAWIESMKLIVPSSALSARIIAVRYEGRRESFDTNFCFRNNPLDHAIYLFWLHGIVHNELKNGRLLPYHPKLKKLPKYHFFPQVLNPGTTGFLAQFHSHERDFHLSHSYNHSAPFCPRPS